MIDQFKVIVSGFVYDNDGKLLVIRRADDEETFPGMLAIPGGTVEVEANAGLQQDTIENNLIRELKEETDVDISVDSWLESSVIAKEKAKLYLFFKCSVAGNSTPKISDETPEVFWAAPEEISVDECTPALATYVRSLQN
jgi:ADP-ribose pyrophosphatase YjhB (NUDIX family)